MMKKNLFVLMISAFVFTNVQVSYAMMECKEDENIPSLPTPSLSKQPRTKKWTPQAPMKESQLGTWIKRANRSPEEYRIVGNTLWIYQ